MRVMIVDDDDVSLELMRSSLSVYGDYEIETACDGVVALERVLAGKFTVVISNWVMPGMNGVELCRRIRAAELPHYVFIILVSGHDGIGNLVECLAAGADEFIPKPFEPAELNARVRSMQRLARLHASVELKNDELERSQELKNDWIGMIVHDLRSPMATILGNLELLERDRAFASSAERLANMRREALRMNGMLEQMLLMGRSEAGVLKLARTPVDVIELANAGAESVSARAEARDVFVSVSHDGGPFKLRLDGSLIRRVIDNLLDNAVRFSPVGGVVAIELNGNERCLTVTVSDQGPGIPEGLRASIFEKYHTGNAGKGLGQHGLGLAFCRMVVEAHGGTIVCAPGEHGGTIFTLRLPIAEDRAVTIDPRVARAAS